MRGMRGHRHGYIEKVGLRTGVVVGLGAGRVKRGEEAEISGAVSDPHRDHRSTGGSRRCQNRSEVWGSGASQLFMNWENASAYFLEYSIYCRCL
jgi:hypothetical protein